MNIFVINLKRSRDRKERMQEKLAALESNPLFTTLGLHYEFFNATDTQEAQFEAYKARFSPTRCYLWLGRVMIDSEIACYASHYRLWEECVRLDEPIVVLEDDVYFEAHFLSALADITRTDLPFVRFHTSARLRDVHIHSLGHSHYHYSLKNTNGLLGYYLTPRAARAFLAQEMWDCPVDIAMEFVARTHIDNIIYKPFMVGEDSTAIHSTIVNSDGSHRTSGGGGGMALRYRILRPFYRAMIQARRLLFKLCYTPPRVSYTQTDKQ